MGLPHTLPGIIGFMIVVSALIGMVTTSSNQNTANSKLSSDLSKSINQTVNSDNIFSGILNTGSTGILMFSAIFVYVNNFAGIVSTMLPEQFSLFSLLIVVMAMIALLKFIRGVWDY